MFQKTAKSKLFLSVISILLLIYSIITIICYFFIINFATEIWISFLPYHLSVFIIVIAILAFFHIKRSHSNFANLISIFNGILILFLICNFFSFYYIKPANQINTGTNVKILSFNKLYENKSYVAIKFSIGIVDPDVIGLIETTDDSWNYFHENLAEKYPYQKRDRFNGEAKGFAIFSKYPFINNYQDNFDTENSSSAKIVKEGKEFIFIVAHPYPPFTQQSFMNERNFLNNLSTNIQKTSEPIILAGDFNLTPWSPMYRNFLKNSQNIKDISKGKGVKFTWSSLGLNLDIDHIFVSKNAEVNNFKIGEHLGSDHKMIWGEVRLK